MFDRLEERTIQYDDDGTTPEYGVHLSLRNNVLAYPKWDIALARVPFFRENGVYNEDYVFATGDQELQGFLAGVRGRERKQNMNRAGRFDRMERPISSRLLKTCGTSWIKAASRIS